jgi:hypothetical protein
LSALTITMNRIFLSPLKICSESLQPLLCL